MARQPRLKQSPMDKRLEQASRNASSAAGYFSHKADKITQKADRYTRPL